MLIVKKWKIEKEVKMDMDLREIVGGALQEKFQYSFDRVMENLQDVNMPFKDVREIVIKMKFTQNETRDDVMSEIQISEKLASQSTMKTRFAVGKDLATGNIVVEEYGTQLKGQMQINRDVLERIPNGFKETEENGVVDFRKVK